MSEAVKKSFLGDMYDEDIDFREIFKSAVLNIVGDTGVDTQQAAATVVGWMIEEGFFSEEEEEDVEEEESGNSE